MKAVHFIILVIGILLIVIHGFWHDQFRIDRYTILIYFVISIPIVAQYLKKAKLPWAEFEFREEMHETKKFVQQSIIEAKESNAKGKTHIASFETFNVHTARNMVDSDPVLALASLRIEIEKTLQLAAEKLSVSKNTFWSISKLIDALSKNEILSSGQANALKKIVNMCNKTIHGYNISKEEATEILDLTDGLNKSFSMGYSINFSENENYKQQNLMCELEHCVEWMPLGKKGEDDYCSVFLGHKCPGGKEKKLRCTKKLEDIKSSGKTIFDVVHTKKEEMGNISKESKKGHSA